MLRERVCYLKVRILKQRRPVKPVDATSARTRVVLRRRSVGRSTAFATPVELIFLIFFILKLRQKDGRVP